MATTKVIKDLTEFNPGNPDYVLNATNAVTVINAGGNQYNFNGVYGKFGLRIGTTILTGIPSTHPFTIVNNGKTSQITISGSDTVSGNAPDGDSYTFYYNTATITVTADFGTISYACSVHGYMGGENNFVSVYSEAGLRMPSSNAAYSGPTVAEGMMRNEVGQVSESSASTMQHYNGTDWKNFVNVSNAPATFATHYLVVAGGAGGGSNGGGGGAGGLLSTTTYGGSGSALGLSLSTAYTITVGAGGAGLAYPAGYQLVGPPGSPSTISGSFTGSPITSAGGGGGASNNVVAADGGSGGGGGSTPTGANAPGTATPAGQGFNGGTAQGGGQPYTGGGGGGAGAVGVASTSVGGAGGAGKVINIIGSNFTYAGGGGGTGGTQGGAGGAGGTGGGGAGGVGSGGASGQGATVPNSGSGGGSSGDAGVTGAGAAGVIILRYPSASVASFVITGTLNTPTPATVGTDKVITFTTGTGTITFS